MYCRRWPGNATFHPIQGSYHLENWYREQRDLPDNYIVVTLSTGWKNEVKAYKAYILEIYL